MLDMLDLPQDIIPLIIQFMDIDSRRRCNLLPSKIEMFDHIYYPRHQDGVVMLSNYFIIATSEQTFCIQRVYEPMMGYNIHILNRNMKISPKMCLIDWAFYFDAVAAFVVDENN